MATSRCYLCHYCGTVSEVDARDLKPDGAMFEEALYKNEIFKDNEVYELDNCLFAKYSDTDKELKLIYERSHPKVSKVSNFQITRIFLFYSVLCRS